MAELFDEAGKWLISQGILGIVVFGLAYAYWAARKQQQDTQQACFDSFKENHRATLDAIHSNNAAIADVVEATKARTEASAAIAKAQELLAAEHNRITQEVARLRAVVEANNAALNELLQELIRKGVVS